MLNVMPNPVGTTRAQSLVREYVALTKPGILSLLLFTTLCGMMVAANGVAVARADDRDADRRGNGGRRGECPQLLHRPRHRRHHGRGPATGRP